MAGEFFLSGVYTMYSDFSPPLRRGLVYGRTSPGKEIILSAGISYPLDQPKTPPETGEFFIPNGYDRVRKEIHP
jgi:hypothetical protein